MAPTLVIIAVIAGLALIEWWFERRHLPPDLQLFYARQEAKAREMKLS